MLDLYPTGAEFIGPRSMLGASPDIPNGRVSSLTSVKKRPDFADVDPCLHNHMCTLPHPYTICISQPPRNNDYIFQ
jgi:hypothetical protein